MCTLPDLPIYICFSTLVFLCDTTQRCLTPMGLTVTASSTLNLVLVSAIYTCQAPLCVRCQVSPYTCVSSHWSFFVTPRGDAPHTFGLTVTAANTLVQTSRGCASHVSTYWVFAQAANTLVQNLVLDDSR